MAGSTEACHSLPASSSVGAVVGVINLPVTSQCDSEGAEALVWSVVALWESLEPSLLA